MEITVTVLGDQVLLNSMQNLKGFFQSRELRVALEDAKNALVRLAIQATPKKSRFLASSISGQVEDFGTDNPKIRAGSSARYAPYVEDHTKPHQILPKNKRALFWVDFANPQNKTRLQGAGAVFTFARKVNHPGTRPQPFLGPAMVAVKPRLLSALVRLLEEKAKGA